MWDCNSEKHFKKYWWGSLSFPSCCCKTVFFPQLNSKSTPVHLAVKGSIKHTEDPCYAFHSCPIAWNGKFRASRLDVQISMIISYDHGVFRLCFLFRINPWSMWTLKNHTTLITLDDQNHNVLLGAIAPGNFDRVVGKGGFMLCNTERPEAQKGTTA